MVERHESEEFDIGWFPILFGSKSLTMNQLSLEAVGLSGVHQEHAESESRPVFADLQSSLQAVEHSGWCRNRIPTRSE